MSEDQDPIERQVSFLFESALDKLGKIDERSQKEKSQVVMELARDLEGKIPTDTICKEIVKRLPRGIASERLIRDCLDEKYKQIQWVENARKQKKKKIQESSEDPAAPMPLNSEEKLEGKTIVMAHYVNGKSTEEHTSNLPSKHNNLLPDNNTNTLVTKISEQVGLENQFQQVLPECSNCLRLSTENRELMEALEKTQLTTADKVKSASQEDDILEFEIHLLKQEVLDYFGTDGDSKIWVSVKVDRKNRRVISRNLVRKSRL
jgi:hypothetical protein